MKKASIDGAELEYEVVGKGEPVLLVAPVLANGFVPLMREPTLASRFQLIHYHRRGWAGSTHAPGVPVTIEQHAADAAALLGHLRLPRVHVVGHSSGAAVAVQLALDMPDLVHSLSLLELSLLSLPEGQRFLDGARPVFEMYERGEHEQAFAAFMTAVSGLDWPTCRALLERRAPGMVAQAIEDADTFFGIELPSLAAWTLTARQASMIRQPTLWVQGAMTLPLWFEVSDFLRAHVSRLDECRIDGVGHLLHLQQPEPVARGIARFLADHRMERRAQAGREARPS